MVTQSKPSSIKQENRALLPSVSIVREFCDELHRVARDRQPVTATNHGMPMLDDQNSLKAEPRGPVLLEDFVLREKIWDHESSPECIVHASSLAAHG